MKRRQILGFLGIAVAGLLLAIGLPLVTPSSVVAQSSTNITVSAASSLKDALEEIKPLYQQSKSNINISYNFGASGALQQQIEQGAPADIFISAGQKQVDALEQKGLLLPGSRTNLANNSLVLIVAQDVVGISSFSNLISSRINKIAIGEPRSVPAGQYGEEVLKNLKLYDQLKSKFVFGNNVRQVLAAVESGNAQAGIVYATDAKTSNKVKVVVTADEKLHSPIVYPVVVIKSSKNISAAKQFVQFLSGSQAKTVLRKYGFIV
ncbi:molybdenum ABC transporter periplasmic molybdate-binding protein [Nostoc commune NIES-4072]|uniref:Molybdenum ABC transporter periplasmic molybdate-binding protein n=1 Tax=Nostoc commune NIES-4072 TaxID=2005467 RepID=A0A2R5FSD8_NOSCO|nr:molybdate ABC transporter substrate-binding protein [Nostoc commune]BBD67336.1 molybdenum ABC transporter periplasmic molybdate-binding protein [Nostoc commune HK-02]GBG21682.1 molybdenum ABC transporter periplasmic molybdate-binding protein [Nostoc commune NIES-4072]